MYVHIFAVRGFVYVIMILQLFFSKFITFPISFFFVILSIQFKFIFANFPLKLYKKKTSLKNEPDLQRKMNGQQKWNLI